MPHKMRHFRFHAQHLDHRLAQFGRRDDPQVQHLSRVVGLQLAGLPAVLQREQEQPPEVGKADAGASGQQIVFYTLAPAISETGAVAIAWPPWLRGPVDDVVVAPLADDEVSGTAPRLRIRKEARGCHVVWMDGDSGAARRSVGWDVIGCAAPAE
jgi:hypothetical protein